MKKHQQLPELRLKSSAHPQPTDRLTHLLDQRRRLIEILSTINAEIEAAQEYYRRRAA